MTTDALRGLRSHTVQVYLKSVCVCACVHAYTNFPEPPHTHTLQSSPCEAGGPSFGLGGGRGEHAPLSQVGVQSVEDAELLFRLKHQQLLQHLAGVRSPERQRLQM